MHTCSVQHSEMIFHYERNLTIPFKRLLSITSTILTFEQVENTLKLINSGIWYLDHTEYSNQFLKMYIGNIATF